MMESTWLGNAIDDLERLAGPDGGGEKSVAAPPRQPSPPGGGMSAETEPGKSEIQVMSSMVLEIEDDIFQAGKYGDALGLVIDEIQLGRDPGPNESLREVLLILQDNVVAYVHEIDERWKAITEMEICAR